MPAPILATKLYMPAPRARVVPRPRLIERLDAGLEGKLTLISAAAGCGKTTLVSAWIAALHASHRPLGEEPGVRATWLSLDEGDGDPARFLTYLIAALQTVAPVGGQGALAALQAPQPPPPEAILTAVLNDLAALPARLMLVLDDYHAVDAPAGDQALAFLEPRTSVGQIMKEKVDVYQDPFPGVGNYWTCRHSHSAGPNESIVFSGVSSRTCIRARIL